MRSTFLLATLLAASLASTACTDDPMTVDEPESGSLVALPDLGNGSELAATLQLGTATTSVNLLRKRLDVAPIAPRAGLEVGPAFLTRPSVDAERSTAFVFVRNTGEARRCYVHLESIVYQDGAGAIVDTKLAAWILGSIGQKGELATDTCLAPGESGYVVDVLDAPYDDVARLDFALDEGVDDYVAPASTVVAQTMDGSPREVTMTTRNQGPVRATLALAGTMYIAFDSLHQPLDLGYFTPCRRGASRTIPVGERLKLCSPGHEYAGVTSTILPRVSFADTFDDLTPVTDPTR
jgi:hypothetical protein